MILRKIAFRFAIGITLIGLVVAFYGYYSYRRPLPQTEGAVEVVGLTEEVTIYRDEWGVPHIYATNTRDLFIAQGYVEAQDRWWQMEMNRHIGTGTLSRIMGNDENIQSTDRFIRTVGWNRIAEDYWRAASPESRRVLEAYATGVNQYIESRSQGDLAVQYTILGLTGRGFEITPWEPTDSFAWLTAFAWQQSGNLAEEIENAQQVKDFGEAVLQASPPNDFNYGPLNLRLVGDIDPADLAFIPSYTPRSSGWVVSGEMTESGYPLLANDIQSNITIPSDWYEIGLHCIEISPECPYDVVGLSLMGMPGVLVGHNGSIGWGLSIANADTQDTYVIDINPQNPRQYQLNGEWAEMDTFSETIEVNGAENITVPVYTTQYGVVISDTLQQRQALTLKWAGSQPTDIMKAIIGLNTASNWTDFRRALQNWGLFPAEFLFADTTGDIGIQTAGTIPDRRANHNYPIPNNEWTRIIPFNQLPSIHDPETRWLIAANHPIGAPSPRRVCGEDNRYERIRGLLRETQQHNPDSFAAIQADTYDGFAECLMPYIQNIGFPFDEEETDEDSYLKWIDYQQWLGNWNFQTEVDSPYPVLFAVFWVELVNRVFDDELLLETSGDSDEQSMIFWLLEQPDHPWWDDITTPDIVEDRDTTLRMAFIQAIETAEDQFGSIRDRWQWGDLHTATFRSIPLGESNVAAIDELLNRGNMAVSGSNDTLNNTRWSTPRVNRYQVTTLSAFRMILDLSDFENSRSILSTGQSGHPASENYADMIELWGGVGYRDMQWEFQTINNNADSTLRLQPASQVLG